MISACKKYTLENALAYLNAASLTRGKNFNNPDFWSKWSEHLNETAAEEEGWQPPIFGLDNIQLWPVRVSVSLLTVLQGILAKGKYHCTVDLLFH
jgi:hypothetical protein